MHETIDRQKRLLKLRRLRVKRLLKPLPRRANIHTYPVIRRFSQFASKHGFFWSYKEIPMRNAFYIGSIVTLLPFLGFQIVVAFILAWIFRANLSVTVGLQFVSNLLTAAPIYFLTYNVGMIPLVPFIGLDASWLWALVAVMIGGVVCGIVMGFALNGMYRYLLQEHKRRQRHIALLTDYVQIHGDSNRPIKDVHGYPRFD